jgi:F-type H+-transporting ATPase subunit delta
MSERIEQAARVYAQALYEAATDADRVEAVDRDFQALLATLAENRSVLRTLLNPRLPTEARNRIVAGLTRNADPLVRNGLMVLAEKGRLSLIHDVQIAFRELAAVEERVLDVEITSAVPLAAPQVDELERRISSATGLTARLSASVDPSIIGGLVIRARGVLLDASIRRELDNLRRTLITTPLPTGSQA